ncbi:hypothetical protein MKZ38_003502 [Zalerion maritima]|uniref:Uncharacterized protein n=1 Tax=Zalerion maritima TaxID=339359 RepID=A0AAD5WX43_9PEZI|nr:hypothetical protein MKZ38_003502 [Zalerion maritima]
MHNHTDHPPAAILSPREARATYRDCRKEARAAYRDARSEWRSSRREARQTRRDTHHECRRRHHHHGCHSPRTRVHGDSDRERQGPEQQRRFGAGAFLFGVIAKTLGMGNQENRQARHRAEHDEGVVPYGDEKGQEEDSYKYDGGHNKDYSIQEESAGSADAKGHAVEIDGTQMNTLFGQRVAGGNAREDNFRDEPLPRYEAVVRGNV